MNNIPSNAKRISYDYGRGCTGYFHIWQTDQAKWQWEALGSNGEEATSNQAIETAKVWIRYHVLNTHKGEE